MPAAPEASPRQGASLSPGTVLSERYRLESILGAGTFGVVWRARHVHLETECAVKLFDPPPEADPAEASARFLQEARLTARLKSPHLARVFDYGVHEHMPFLVLELLRGRSLAGHLKALDEQGQRLPPAEAARIVQHVAEALNVAHAARVVHRDLKPDNIFLVQEGQSFVAKVLDFGIAKWSTDASPSMTTTRVVMGTAHYMSPEQFESARNVDHRSDLWSLGVVAFECLTGRVPFPGETFIDVAFRVCKEGPLVASQVAAVPAGFDEWFARATALGREQRFDSALEQAQALGRVCSAEAGSRTAGGLRAAPALTPALIPSAAPSTGEGVATERGTPLRQIPRPPPLVWVGAACVVGLLLWGVLSAGLPEPAVTELGSEALSVQPASGAPSAAAAGAEPPAAPGPAGAAGSAPDPGPDEPKIRPIEPPILEAAALPQETRAPTRTSSAAGTAPTPERREEARTPAPTVEAAPGARSKSSPEVAGATGASAQGSAVALQPVLLGADPGGDPETGQGVQNPSGSTFNREAARAALQAAAVQAQNCRPPGGVTGSGRVEVRYEPSGRIAAVTLLTSKFADTETGNCVKQVFRRATVPAFSGVPVVTVAKSFEIAPSNSVSGGGPAPVKTECIPPWYIDAMGIRRIKPMCL